MLPNIRKYGFYKLFSNHYINNMITIADEKQLHHKVVSFLRKKYNTKIPSTKKNTRILKLKEYALIKKDIWLDNVIYYF